MAGGGRVVSGLRDEDQPRLCYMTMFKRMHTGKRVSQLKIDIYKKLTDTNRENERSGQPEQRMAAGKGSSAEASERQHRADIRPNVVDLLLQGIKTTDAKDLGKANHVKPSNKKSKDKRRQGRPKVQIIQPDWVKYKRKTVMHADFSDVAKKNATDEPKLRQAYKPAEEANKTKRWLEKALRQIPVQENKRSRGGRDEHTAASVESIPFGVETYHDDRDEHTTASVESIPFGMQTYQVSDSVTTSSATLAQANSSIVSDTAARRDKRDGKVSSRLSSEATDGDADTYRVLGPNHDHDDQYEMQDARTHFSTSSSSAASSDETETSSTQQGRSQSTSTDTASSNSTQHTHSTTTLIPS